MNICGIMFTITYQHYFIFCFLFVYNLTYPFEDTGIYLFIFVMICFFVHNDVSLGSWE